jgi:ATP-dependent DNA helicase RecQ
MAESRPEDLDAFARIEGVGAKKLQKYGRAFLEVISGIATEPPHPARRKLAGGEAGAIYDQLLAAQSELARGEAGTEKPLSCSASLLSRIARLRNADRGALERLLGTKRSERFGEAFFAIVQEAEA